MKLLPRATLQRSAICAGLALLLLAHSAWAQSRLVQPVTARSHSGQFLIQGLAQPYPLSDNLRRSAATNWIRLTPPLAAVSCERIKEALLERLDCRDRWQGRIFVSLRPIRRPEDGCQVTQTRFTDGWTYRLDLPDAVEPTKFVRAVVSVLIAERAHRFRAGEATDVPAWLVDGLAQELLSDRALDLVVRPPDTLVNSLNVRQTSRQDRRTPTLSAAQTFFTDGRTPLTFDELCRPAPEAFVDETASAFRYSSQLFVHELLLLRNGRASLGAMLDRLGQCRNWQAALLQTFPSHFARLLDVDKWWELHRLGFPERGVSVTWGVAASLNKLEEALPVAVQRQVGTNNPGPRATIPLQAFLQQADEARQLELLPGKIQQLQSLPLRAAPEVAPLVGNYIRTLEDYRHQLFRNSHAPPPQRMNRFMFNRVLRNAIRQLDALDAARFQLAQPHVSPPPGAPALGQPARTR